MSNSNTKEEFGGKVPRALLFSKRDFGRKNPREKSNIHIKFYVQNEVI